jgi:serine/threonine protein kinase
VLGESLGRGGFGAVYKAHDSLSKQEVAVKLLHRLEDAQTAQFRAEVSLLRLLRLPNLVHLLDDGVQDGQPFLVTELVDGTQFPGVPAPTSWEEVREPAVRLLEAIGRVHAQGVVHRDLKPANVLVKEDGTPVVLDFGVSFGPGFVEAGEPAVVGTPAFLAPEQAIGRKGDARSDLYSIGVMLYEALTGRLPHEDTKVTGLLRSKLHEPAQPIATLVPGLPPQVASTIDSMLRIEPVQRPRSAGEVLQQMGERRVAKTMPWLGTTTTIQTTTEHLLAGESLVLTGRSGLGRTRFLHEVGGHIADAGRPAWSTRASRHRWGSLPSPVRKRLQRITDATDREIESVLQEGLTDGAIVLVDDTSRVDPATRRALVLSGLPCAWVGVDSSALGTVELEPLSRDAIRGLFHGPDLVFQLVSDASKLAHDRSGGEPKRLTALVEAWRRTGLCYWDAGKIRITREALDRLMAGLIVAASPTQHTSGTDGLDDLLSWVSLAGTTASRNVIGQVSALNADAVSRQLDLLIADGRLNQDSAGRLTSLDTLPASLPQGPLNRESAHGAIAEAMQIGAPGRLLHLIRAGKTKALLVEALCVADRAQATGRLGDGFASLREALAIIRLDRDPEHEYALLRATTLLGIEMQSARGVDLALYEVERSVHRSERVSRLGELLDATRIVRYRDRGKPRAMATAEALRPFDEDSALEKWRRAGRMVAGFGLDPASHRELAQEQLTWANSTGVAPIVASVTGWLAVSEFRCGDFVGAAARHESAARLAESPAQEALAWMNAGTSWLEAGSPSDARRCATRAGEISKERRLTHIAARSYWLERSARQRDGETLEPNREMIQAIHLIDQPVVRAKAWEVAAGEAWRSGDLARAAAYASHCAEEFSGMGAMDGECLARAVVCAATGTVDARCLEYLVERAEGGEYPRITAQIAALLALKTVEHTFMETLRISLLGVHLRNRGTEWEFLSHPQCEDILAGR